MMHANRWRSRLTGRWTSALALTALYVLLSLLWIFLSDELLAGLIRSPRLLTLAQTVKGTAFVAVTAAVFFLFSRQLLRRLTDWEDQAQTLGEAVEHSPVSITVTDADGRIKYANARCRQWVNHPLTEMVGRRLDDPSAGVLQAEVFEAAWTQVQAGRTWQGDVEQTNGHGDRGWNSCIVSPLCDEQGTLARAIVIQEDITGRIRASERLQQYKAELEDRVRERTVALEETNHKLGQEVAARAAAQDELAASRRFLRSALDALQSHVAVLNDAGTIMHVNEAWRLFAAENGLAGGAGVDVNYLEACDRAAAQGDALAAEAAAGIRGVIAGARSHFTMEYPCHSPDARRWFVMTVTWFTAPAGRRVVVAHENITALKEAQESLRENEELFRTMANGAPVIIWTTDPEGGVTYINDVGLTFLGRPLEQNVGWGWLEAVEPGEATTVRDRIIAAIRSRRPFELEARVRRHDGSLRWLLILGVPRYAGHGRIAGYVGAALDISDRHEAQRLKDQIISLLSHEMHTPLASIRGFAELLLLGRGISDDQQRYVTIIRDEAVRLSQLIRDFLDLQNMEAGRNACRMEDLDFGALVADVVEKFRTAAGDHPVNLHVATGMAPVKADRARMEQLLWNLLGNAAKFSPATAPIEVDAWTHEGSTVLSVRDRGIGVPPEHVVKIFDRFYRIDRPQQDTVPGSGLGLALVRQIVEAHGGQVKVLGRPDNVGSEFRVELPPGVRSSESDAA